MVNTFGANVNFGNIQPNDVISLEALRCGLPGDTFLTFSTRGASGRLFFYGNCRDVLLLF